MFKKLLALAAVATVCTSMNAKVVEDMFVDWTANSWTGYVMGYIPQTSAEEGLIFEWPNFNYVEVDDDGANPNGYEIVNINGKDNYVVPTEDGGPKEDWGIQAHLLKENCPTEIGTTYSVTIYAKANKDGVRFDLPFSWNWNGGTANGSVVIDSEWAEYTCDYADEVGGASCWLVGQMFDKEAIVAVKWVKITHEEAEGPVVETKWEDHLVNGDAEGEFGDIPCCYTKEYGYNNNEPHPALIENIDGNNVFVCHAVAVPDEDFADNHDAVAWQNQIWIQSPQEWAAGQQFRLSFRYKASRANKTNTQCHKQNPGDYLIWHAIGDINFTTEWQEFSKLVTVENDMAGMWSVAFNLGPDEEYTHDTDFYLDDLKWETMVLDEGWFAAAGATKADIVENAAIELEDAGDGTYTGVVGDADNMVEFVKISTKRGDKQAFNANTISVDSGSITDDEDDFIDYVTKASTAIQLPWAGQWQIIVDEEYVKASFKCLISGVESVSVENVAPVYYNLQGVKVLNPANGNIYIVKRGNKVSKEIVR